ncbi:unnamed protein product [Rangifer tarandus platyrhynchus]|uniref:Uncharacterized protein n=1 Tax=Rangifer tarandus platyrhynchus TaxID=3082113 RepID=A0AC59ZGH2_RANTA
MAAARRVRDAASLPSGTAPGSQQPSGGSQTGQRRARRSWAALAARPLPSTSASAVRLGRQDEAPRDPPC